MGNRSPIGLIDSGIGGFTVLQELQRQLPKENIIYLGDSKRMPYGELENDAIIHFANSDIRFLEMQGVKAILLACNTVSSLIDYLTANVPLFSIVEAGCLATIEKRSEGDVGLIATTATVKNKAYELLLETYTAQIHYIPRGTKTLAKVITHHNSEQVILRDNIREAIDPILEKKAVTELLLGCTHFPIVRETIEAMYPKLHIINPADKQVALLKEYMKTKAMCNGDFTNGITKICTTGTSEDYTIFNDMIGQLKIDCNDLEQVVLDIEKEDI